MSAEECRDPFTKMQAHVLRRDKATHAKPLTIAGFIVTSQPQRSEVERAAERAAEAYRKAVML